VGEPIILLDAREKGGESGSAGNHVWQSIARARPTSIFGGGRKSHLENSTADSGLQLSS